MKRPAFARALVFALLVPLFAPDAGAAEIALRGVQSCTVWVEGRAQNDARYEKAWLAGYFSGLAIGTDINFWGTKGPDALEGDAVWKWMDSYCAANPTHSLVQAAEQLFLERFRRSK